MATPINTAGARRRGPVSPPSSPGVGYGVMRRVLFIHERLANGHPANAVSLSQALEVAPRTIKRDLAFMRDELGAPIEWEPATHTYSYSRECDLLPLLRLDATEVLALFLARETFAAWGGSTLGRALTAALGKIAGVIGGAVSLPVTDIVGLVSHSAEETQPDTEQRIFPVALESIGRRRVLRIDYRKPGAPAVETRLVHPLQLAHLDHRWVLIAHDPARNGIRNFLLARIERARATTATFAPPVGFDLSAYLRGSIGRFTGPDEMEVRILVDAALAPYVRERPWHRSQTLTEHPDGSVEIALQLNNLIDIRRRVLACGAHAEVLSPAELRGAIHQEALALAARCQATPVQKPRRPIRK